MSAWIFACFVASAIAIATGLTAASAETDAPAEVREATTGVDDAIEVTLLATSDGSGVAVRAQGLIDAPADRVWPVLKDCDGYAEFLPGVIFSDERGRSGDTSVCVTEIDLPFPLQNLHSEMQVVETAQAERPYYQRRWRLIRGNYRKNFGSWTLSAESADSRRSLAVYTVEIDPQIPIPDFLLRRLQAKSARDLFEAIRERVRTRTAVSAP